MNKNELRREFLQARKNIKNKAEKSDIIMNKILNSSYYKKSQVIALYYSFPDEVDTIKLIKKSLEYKKVVALPKVIDNGEMEFYKIITIEDVKETNSFGVMEPLKKKENFIKKDDIDVMIITGVCFDNAKNRIGFGKGYYDKYLSNETRIFKIGVCFEEQTLKDDTIPIDKYDIKMDIIVTEK